MEKISLSMENPCVSMVALKIGKRVESSSLTVAAFTFCAGEKDRKVKERERMHGALSVEEKRTNGFQKFPLLWVLLQF